MSAITQYDVVFIPRLLGEIVPLRETFQRKIHKTSNTRVLRLKREQEQNVKQVGRQERGLPKEKARFHEFQHSDQRQIQIRFQPFPFEFPDGER